MHNFCIDQQLENEEIPEATATDTYTLTEIRKENAGGNKKKPKIAADRQFSKDGNFAANVATATIHICT
jgi:hypothetical protein